VSREDRRDAVGTLSRLPWASCEPDHRLAPRPGARDRIFFDPCQQPTNGNSYVTVAAASFDFQPGQFGDGPMTFETSPIRMHAIITYMDQTIEVWLVRLS
jgi:hypothetical protein